MNPVSCYQTIEVGYPVILRGTNQQTATGLIWAAPTYTGTARGTLPDTATLRSDGIALGNFELHNRAAATIAVAIGVRIPNRFWRYGLWTDASTTVTDDTTDAQSTAASDAALETTTDNDGYVILSRVKFNGVSIRVGTASSGGSAVRAVRFSNSAGTGWNAAPANLFAQTAATGNYSTGENVVVFAPPYDWGKSSSLATSLPDGYYAMNVRSTTAPTATAGVATAIEVFQLFFTTEGVADNTSLSKDFGAKDCLMGWDATEGLVGDGLVAFFGTANDQNRVTVQVRWP